MMGVGGTGGGSGNGNGPMSPKGAGFESRRGSRASRER